MEIANIIAAYEQKGYILTDPRILKSGKEATVYVVDYLGQKFVLKVYKDQNERSFKDNRIYLEGHYFRKPSERKAALKKNSFGLRLINKGWVRREFHMLDKLYKKGANVPQVFAWTPQSILMEYIGDQESAPRLKDVELTKDQARKAFDEIIKSISLFLESGVIHADLSAFNILWWKDKPYIIDFPQAIDARSNPNTEKLLKRDVDNIISYFERYFEIKSELIYHELDVSNRNCGGFTVQ